MCGGKRKSTDSKSSQYPRVSRQPCGLAVGANFRYPRHMSSLHERWSSSSRECPFEAGLLAAP
jgi:hypothetical protein